MNQREKNEQKFEYLVKYKQSEAFLYLIVITTIFISFTAS